MTLVPVLPPEEGVFTGANFIVFVDPWLVMVRPTAFAGDRYVPSSRLENVTLCGPDGQLVPYTSRINSADFRMNVFEQT